MILSCRQQIGRVDLALQELGAPDDHGEHVVEVVRHAARHLPQRPEALGPDDPLLRLLDRRQGGAELRVEPAVLEGHRSLGREGHREVLGAGGERDRIARDVVERREAQARSGRRFMSCSTPSTSPFGVFMGTTSIDFVR